MKASLALSNGLQAMQNRNHPVVRQLHVRVGRPSTSCIGVYACTAGVYLHKLRFEHSCGRIFGQLYVIRTRHHLHEHSTSSVPWRDGKSDTRSRGCACIQLEGKSLDHLRRRQNRVGLSLAAGSALRVLQA